MQAYLLLFAHKSKEEQEDLISKAYIALPSPYSRTVSDGKVQITALILRQDALSTTGLHLITENVKTQFHSLFIIIYISLLFWGGKQRVEFSALRTIWERFRAIKGCKGRQSLLFKDGERQIIKMCKSSLAKQRKSMEITNLWMNQTPVLEIVLNLTHLYSVAVCKM